MEYRLDDAEFRGPFRLAYTSRGVNDRGICELTADEFAATREPVGLLHPESGVWIDFNTGDRLQVPRGPDSIRWDVTREEAQANYDTRGRTVEAFFGYLWERFTGQANHQTMTERLEEQTDARFGPEYENVPANLDFLDPGQWHFVDGTPASITSFLQRNYAPQQIANTVRQLEGN